MATHVTVTVTTASVAVVRGTATTPTVTAVVNGAIGPRGATGPTPDTDTFVTSDDIRTIVALTQAVYDALTPDPETLYAIIG